jgi:hypothetical protein
MKGDLFFFKRFGLNGFKLSGKFVVELIYG